MPTKEEVQKVPTHATKWFINRLHVSTTDEEIREKMTELIDKAPEPFTDYQRRATIRYAIAVHHTNINLYNSVVTGRF